MTKIALTGATGEIGRRVAARLAERGDVGLRLVVRDAARAPDIPGAEVAVAGDYLGGAALTTALTGADTVLLVSGRESANRVAEHRSAVDAAVAAGARRLVYLSFVNAAPDSTFTFARDHWATEQHIRSTGVDFTFLRDSFYLDLFPAFASPDGVIAGPGGQGRVAGVSRHDVAAVAAVVLAEAGHEGATYDVTGPEAITLADAARQVGEAAGRPVVYREETLEEAYASRAEFGAPAFEVDGWVSTYVAVAKGEMATVADTVPRLTGRPAQTLRDVLAAAPGSLAHLRR